MSLTREFALRRRPDTEPDDPWCENEGDVCDDGVGAAWWPPVAFRFLGDVVYSERR